VDEDSLSPAELVARFSTEELFAASRETSLQYNGIVLAKALVIVQIRTRCTSLRETVQRIGIGKGTVYRWARGRGLSTPMLERALRQLAFLLWEEGVESRHAH
jgi:hypothetical protein